MTKVFVAVNPGFLGNKGDAAIITGMLNLFEEMRITDVTIASENPEFDSLRCKARIIRGVFGLSKKQPRLLRILTSALTVCQHVAIASLSKAFHLRTSEMNVLRKDIWNMYNQADVIVTGLDDSFSTLYGPYGLIDNFSAILLAKLLKKPTVVLAASVGPFHNVVYQVLAKFIHNKADLIPLREEISYQYLQKIGVNNTKMFVTTDLGFNTMPTTINRVKEIMQFESIDQNSRPLIGISVNSIISRWCFPETNNRKQKYDYFVKMIAGIVDYLVTTFSATVIFIPHSIGDDAATDDRIVATDICRLIKNKKSVRSVKTEYSSEELRGLTGQLDLFIGARTHSIIDAASMCVPFIALAYPSHKTNGIVGKGLGHDDLICSAEKLNYDSLKSKIDCVWSRKHEIAKDLKIKIRAVEARIELISRLFKEVIDL